MTHKLTKKVVAAISEWMANGRRWCQVGWVEAAEGKVYCRYNAMSDRADLASIEILEQHRRTGVTRSVIAAVCDLDVGTVRLENIMVEVPSVAPFGKAVAKYQFAGRKTIMTTGWGVATVDFVREEQL